MTRTIGCAGSVVALIAAAPQDASQAAATIAAPTTAAPTGVRVVPPRVVPTVPTPRVAPAPRATPVPRATPTARARERADPIERPAEPPRPRATAAPPLPSAPTILPVPPIDDRGGLIAPSSIATPAPLPSPAPITGLRERPAPPLWPFVALAGAIALIAAGFWFWRRRSGRAAVVQTEFARSEAAENAPSTGFWSPSVPVDLPPPPPPPPVPVPVPTPEADLPGPSFLAPAIERAWLDLDLQPRRAGINLLTATADVEIMLANTGDAAARDVRIDIRMINAADATEAALVGLFDAAMAKPAVPPFALEPGETRSVRAVATMPREAIRPLKMGEREIFVPVLAIDVRYDRGDAAGQSAAAWMIGVTRDGADKLVPFRLDAAKMHDRIGARRHGAGRRT